MISLKRKQQGFTIVELLIVIVVIGILAALVVTTFSGIQRKARDSERQTDINAISSQLEAYHAQNGRYPGLADLQSAAFIQASLTGLDIEAMKDPKLGTTTPFPVATVTATNYGYATTPATCGAGSTEVECTGYVLSADLESETGNYEKRSLN